MARRRGNAAADGESRRLGRCLVGGLLVVVRLFSDEAGLRWLWSDIARGRRKLNDDILVFATTVVSFDGDNHAIQRQTTHARVIGRR